MCHVREKEVSTIIDDSHQLIHLLLFLGNKHFAKKCFNNTYVFNSVLNKTLSYNAFDEDILTRSYLNILG
jgi:hypothetical protein